MVVILFPAPTGQLRSALPIPMLQTEQIVKTSGNLLTSFLIQGGGFKFYQSGSTGQEGIIVKAKLLGAARFLFKQQLEMLRETKRFVTLVATNFGVDTGLVLNTLELNTNNRERDVVNLTMSFQKVIPSKSSLTTLTNIIFGFGDLVGASDVRLMPFAQNLPSFGVSLITGVTSVSPDVLNPLTAIENGVHGLADFASLVG